MERIAAVRTGQGEVKAVEQPMPVLGENQALIRVHASLISPGTEMASVIQARKTPDPKAEAKRFGYANSGVIEKIQGDPKGLKPGMRVFAMGAGFAEHTNWACVPVNLVAPIPDSLSFERACYACLAATALQSVRRAELSFGEIGVVAGLGIVGNLAAQISHLSGARVVGWDTLPFRLKAALACGVPTVMNPKEEGTLENVRALAAPYGVEFSILAFGGDATAAFESIRSCMRMSADGHVMGRVVLVGGCTVAFAGGAANGNLDLRASSRTGPGYHDSAYEHGRDYPAGFVPFTTQRNLLDMIRLIDEKRLVVDPMTTHRLPLAEVGRAADALIEAPDRSLGVILQMP
ncbi:MAG: zinc-binding alcohol dehydrogenase [Kiritimatiellia bacterium]|nr:zinc-binding alcohol dehydrogenase [Kiritimatiellia bacterium]